MSLTPAADDPNRKAELARRKEDPKAFDVNPHAELPKDFNPHSSGLVEDLKKATTAEGGEGGEGGDAEAVRKAWLEYLDRPVVELVEELADVTDVEQLTTMRVVEVESKNRKTLIEAIDNEIQTREGA